MENSKTAENHLESIMVPGTRVLPGLHMAKVEYMFSTIGMEYMQSRLK